MTFALVLEGGAKRGIYTAGILDVLLENNVLANAVFGVSAGAIHGCTYAAKQSGRSIRYNLKHGNDPRFMSIKNWIKTGNVVDTKFCYYELPEILDPFDHKTFETSEIKFYAVCSNIESGKAEYIHCSELRPNKGINYIRASASLPFFSETVEIENKKFLDGGICDSIPLKAAQNHGFKKNIVILTRPEGYRKKASKTAWLSRIVYRKFPKFVDAMLNRHKMYNAQLDFVAEQEKLGNTLVLRPSKKINIKRMEKNLDRVQEMYNLGRLDGLNMLDKIKAFIEKE